MPNDTASALLIRLISLSVQYPSCRSSLSMVTESICSHKAMDGLLALVIRTWVGSHFFFLVVRYTTSSTLEYLLQLSLLTMIAGRPLCCRIPVCCSLSGRPIYQISPLLISLLGLVSGLNIFALIVHLPVMRTPHTTCTCHRCAFQSRRR